MEFQGNQADFIFELSTVGPFLDAMPQLPNPGIDQTSESTICFLVGPLWFMLVPEGVMDIS